MSAGRGLNGAAGYARATIEHSAKQVEQQLPHGVRDHKLANDLAAFKDEIVQRRARLNLASAEESRLQNLKAELESAIERRAVLLRDAAGLRSWWLTARGWWCLRGVNGRGSEASGFAAAGAGCRCSCSRALRLTGYADVFRSD
ncbi:MAG UNVERIFIED_CONTAM: hypothetical protein LVR18_47360 [Planctomycetaceae bacterium]